MSAGRITLEWTEQFGFGLGHILNDIVASVWFAYTLIFYKLAIGAQGYILVVFGQGVDCLATLFIGFFFDCDTSGKPFFSTGKYRTWFMVGFVLSFLAFCHCFLELPYMIEDKQTMFIIYMCAGFFAQLGWTFCQISHLALLNVLSVNTADRIRLTALRQGGSIYGAVIVFGYFWYTLAESETHILNKEDIKLFANNIFWLTNFGTIHTLLFLYLLNEPELVERKRALLSDNFVNAKSMTKSLRRMDVYTKKDWLTEPVFYVVMFIFMFSRLYQNLLFTYVPLYLQYYLYLTKETIAIVPLIIYVTGFVCSYMANHIENCYGNQVHIFVGVIVGFCAHIFIGLGSCHSYAYTQYYIFLIAVLLGISTTTIKIASMSIVGEMIGHNHQCTSFVYAMVSLADKSLGGLVIGILEQFNENIESEKIFPNYEMLTNNMTMTTTTTTIATTITTTMTKLVQKTCPGTSFPSVILYYNINFLACEFILFMIAFGILFLTRFKFK